MAQGACDPDNLTIALTGMANSFGAAAGRGNDRANQLAGDSSAMWSIAMTSPTVMAGFGIRTATESGSGRTRAETNAPAGTAAQ
tara:strand:- start:26135 stop:26386 length:252 start_codon:yes stop_codon:yes gene_type:complete